MKQISLLITIIFVVTLMFISTIADAETVQWITEQYTAEAFGNVQSGPPLPITSSYNHPFLLSHRSESTITNSYMDVKANSNLTNGDIYAEAEFFGTYTATTSNPLFRFTYDGLYESVNRYYSYSDASAWLIVSDVTDSTVLYDNSSLTLDGATYAIDISTEAGHEISVNFGAKAYASAYNMVPPNYEAVLLNYSMAVAPEPLSSILFVTGGTLLAGRRYIKRKKKV